MRPVTAKERGETDQFTEYMHEIGRYSLLSPDEEKNLGRRVELGRTVAETLEQSRAKRADQPNTLAAKTIIQYGDQPVAGTPKERSDWRQLSQEAVPRNIRTELYAQDGSNELEQALQAHFNELIQDGENAHTEFVHANLRLVVSIARRTANRGLDLMELIQEGNAGLIRAVDGFDHRTGNRFSTYATWWIRQAMEHAIAQHARAIRIPRGVLTQSKRLLAVTDRLTAELMRTPSDSEIGAEMGITPEEVRNARWLTREIRSLDENIGEHQDNPIHEIIADPNAEDPEQQAMEGDLRNRMAILIDNLPDREATVLRLRFGLGDDINRTQQEVSHHLGISRQGVHYIEKRALKRLRQEKGARELLVFLQV